MRRGRSIAIWSSQYDDLVNLAEQHRLEEVMARLDDLLIRDGKEGGLLKELGKYQQTFHQIKEWENYNSLSQQELKGKWNDLGNRLSLFIDRVAAAIPA